MLKSHFCSFFTCLYFIYFAHLHMCLFKDTHILESPQSCCKVQAYLVSQCLIQLEESSGKHFQHVNASDLTVSVIKITLLILSNALVSGLDSSGNSKHEIFFAIDDVY